jgi:hypothetical protein
VFASEELGRIFLPAGLRYEDAEALYISPLHGRAVALKIPNGWISVKGGGWTYGGPQIYISQKDEELIFGLYALSAAKRELAISREIEKFSNDFPKILYYKEICSSPLLPDRYRFLSDITFANGTLVNPCLLYTQVKTPFRVADLMYLTKEEQEEIIRECSNAWGVESAAYAETFVEMLAKRVATLHKHGFINDTLDYGNVTLMAEIVDYEWVTAPGINLPDGTNGLVICDDRREKEILYGAEICLQLCALLRLPYDLFSIYAKFVSAYEEINPQFIKNNMRTQKILNHEDFVL